VDLIRSQSKVPKRHDGIRQKTSRQLYGSSEQRRVLEACASTEREKRRDRLPHGPDPGKERKRLTSGPSGFLNINQDQIFNKLDSIQMLASNA
jgi:hypothetical protein